MSVATNRLDHRDRAFRQPRGAVGTLSTPAQGSHVIDCTPWRSGLVRLHCARSRSRDGTLEEFLTDAHLCADELPRQLRYQLLEFRLKANEHGALLLKGLPRDSSLAATPTRDHHRARDFGWSAWWLALFGSRFGSLVGYRQEQGGTLFQNIVPGPGHEHVQSSAGSVAPLEFHTETCFHPHLPSYVLLYCLRADHDRKALTYCAGVRNIVQKLSPVHRELLRRPLFRTGVDYSFGHSTSGRRPGPILSVLYGNAEDPFIRWDLDLMEGMTFAARDALAAVAEATDAVKCGMRLEPGDLLVLANRRTVHGRGGFTPQYDGRDRWLQRALVVSDLDASANDRTPSTRVIDTREFAGGRQGEAERATHGT